MIRADEVRSAAACAPLEERAGRLGREGDARREKWRVLQEHVHKAQHIQVEQTLCALWRGAQLAHIAPQTASGCVSAGHVP